MRRLRLGLVIAIAACGSRDPVDPPDAEPPDAPPPVDALVSLPLGVGHYRGACDGSAAIALDFDRFVGFDDEDQLARVYVRGATDAAIQSVDLGPALDLVGSGEADLEDAVRADDRLYVIGSHGRTDNGTLDRNRYRLLTLDATLQPLGRAETLLDDMLDRDSWVAPDDVVIGALADASQLDRTQVANLAPKVGGTNIEGLARAPTTGAPDRLAIGFRNPRPGDRAIVVTLLDAADTVATTGGERAHFGEAYLLDLGGLGVRGLAWSDSLAAMFVLAGPSDGSDGPFRLYRWEPDRGELALVTELLPPAGAKPEAVVTYPGTRDVQILFDTANVEIAGTPCDQASPAEREFFDQILHIE